MERALRENMVRVGGSLSWLGFGGLGHWDSFARHSQSVWGKNLQILSNKVKPLHDFVLYQHFPPQSGITENEEMNSSHHGAVMRNKIAHACVKHNTELGPWPTLCEHCGRTSTYSSKWHTTQVSSSPGACSHGCVCRGGAALLFPRTAAQASRGLIAS